MRDCSGSPTCPSSVGVGGVLHKGQAASGLWIPQQSKENLLFTPLDDGLIEPPLLVDEFPHVLVEGRDAHSPIYILERR
jgi:hypothetical protein